MLLQSLLLLAAIESPWPSYKVVPLAPNMEFANGSATAVNKAEKAVFNVFVERRYKAFLWDHGKLTDLGSLGGDDAMAHDINDKGQIVGQSKTKEGNVHAFLWEKGQMRDLGTLDGDKNSYAFGINNFGDIVGGSHSDQTHAFLWRAGTGMKSVPEDRGVAADISDRGVIAVGNCLLISGQKISLEFSPLSVNNRGKAVGAVSTGGVHYGARIPMMYNGNRSINVAHLGGTNAAAFSINDADWIVGVSFNSDKGQFAWLNISGIVKALDSLLVNSDGWNVYFAMDINASGTIAGAAKLKNGKGQPVILIPMRGKALPKSSHVSGFGAG